MSGLRNVGELASPYFLLELWVRRHEIDIDPETYATLKRKARRLVRDGRIAQDRGDDPDEEWRARRLELLGFEDLLQKSFALEDGSEFPLLLWRDAEGHEAALIGDLAGFGDADQRADKAADPPSTAFELAVDAYQGDADWGLLLAGHEIRLYRRSSGISQQYLALSLDDLVELDDEPLWQAFAGIFRASAFALDSDGVPLIRRVVDESRRHASALAADMRRDVVDAAEAIIQGALDDPANAELLADPSRQTLHALFEETLYYLYRVLFILYGEARDVLPVSSGEAGPYATSYSIDHLVELARDDSQLAEGTYFGDTLRRLFALLYAGPPAAAQALGIEPVGGELFDPSRTTLLDRCVIGDAAWRRALSSIALGAPGTKRREIGRRASFTELGVDQLGSIYEGLLVLEPYLAPGDRLLVREGEDRRVVDPGSQGALRVERHVQAGDFVLESASGRRKGSGSFYTPAEITEYLANAALQPLLDPILERAHDDPWQAAQDIRKLRVCDPAMGSGAFLVQAARVMGRGLARVKALRGDGRVTPELVKLAEREVVRNCLYGVDLNPLAVALAKVSLWLETLEKGRPLSFLDNHLRCGDSLVGVDFMRDGGLLSAAELATWPKDATKGLKTYLTKEAGERGRPLLKRLAERKGLKKAEQAQLPGLDVGAVENALADIASARDALISDDTDGTLTHERAIAEAFRNLEQEEGSLRNRLRAAADFWCAQWFADGEDAPSDEVGSVVPVGEAQFQDIVALLVTGEPIPTRFAPHVAAAGLVASRRRFFHWALEFPEVIADGGFDAVIGNPPWNTLSPDVKEFFGTYDHQAFSKSVPRAAQAARQSELRNDLDIDAAWRTEARFLHELSAYAKPESRRFTWFAADGQLRKGDADVFRLFVERSYGLLAQDGHLALVLPDSLYVSSPATGVRQHLLIDGVLERCYAFENSRKLFPIQARKKVVLLSARRGTGPTERFNAAFFVGKDTAGHNRAISLDQLPSVLAGLDASSPTLEVEQIRALAPQTWAFPEIRTKLDAEIAAHCATSLPPLNLDDRGWRLKYCRELDADKDAWRFKGSAELEAMGAQRDLLRWRGPNDEEWWPLIELPHIYNLDFPVSSTDFKYWVNAREVSSIAARRNQDGRSVMHHYRVAWRDIARNTDERTMICGVLTPRTTAKDKIPTVWGGSLGADRLLTLAALLSSLPFDYLLRFRGATSLKYGIVNAVPAPPFSKVAHIAPIAAEVVCRNAEFDALWVEAHASRSRPSLDLWQLGERRALIDAEVAVAYGLSLTQFCAVICAFPNLDTIQPRLPGEPKSFVTRDLALHAYCQIRETEPADISDLLSTIGVDLPEPKLEDRRLDRRIARYRELGALPYLPTPRGGRRPEDPELLNSVTELIGAEPMTAADLADAIGENERTVAAVLKKLIAVGEVFAEGRGRMRRYYVIEDD